MPVKVFALHDARYLPLARVTVPRIEEFAVRHGYQFILQTQRLCALPTSWSKLALMLQHLKPDDTGIWLDCDIVVRNPYFDLEPWFPQDGIAFSQDKNGLCAGAFITRGDWSLDFFNALIGLGDVEGCYKWEQDAIKVLQKYFPSVSKHFSFIPEEHLSNPATLPFVPNPFAVHMWADHWRLSNAVNAAQRILVDWNFPLQCQINGRETIVPLDQTPSLAASLAL